MSAFGLPRGAKLHALITAAVGVILSLTTASSAIGDPAIVEKDGDAVRAPAASAHAGGRAPVTPPCANLAVVVERDPDVPNATSAVVQPTASVPAYCDVELSQRPAINVRVGLPLSREDGGSGGSVNGAWNGEDMEIGGGAYAGSITGQPPPPHPVGTIPGDLSFALSFGDVGSTTDTGHSPQWCNAINRFTGLTNSQPDCGLAGGGFVLDPRNKLLWYQVKDFITDSLVDQTEWARRLTDDYYGTPARHNYWFGTSTGGRQGFEMAQKYAYLFDGFLVAAPAFNWNQFIISEAYPAVVVNNLLGANGLSPAKSAAANAAAIAACGDTFAGVNDGFIQDPRTCAFDARSLICKGFPTEPSTCLTPTEAEAIDMIWNGPVTPTAQRMWGGISKGTSFDTLLPGGNSMGALIQTYLANWLEQNPNFDYHTLTIADFDKLYYESFYKFQGTASTDDANLNEVRNSGAKIITWHGEADPLIVPFGSYNYQQRVFDRYGVQRTQSFMRAFFFPGVAHVAGGAAPQPDLRQMFIALQDWVEKGIAPDHVVASQTLPARVCLGGRLEKRRPTTRERIVNVRSHSNRQIGSGKHTARLLYRRSVVVGVAALLAAVLLLATGPREHADAAPVRSAPTAHPPAGLQPAVDRLVADGQPGVIVMTRRGDEVSHVTGGVADEATGQPMRTADRVHIGSITKTFVATAILQLVAEQRLSLDDSVQRWLPGIVAGHGYHPDRITIRDLLLQTSGLRDYTNTPGFETPRVLRRTWKPRQLVAAALRLGPPLSGWNYSDTNYILAGMLIRRVTGQSPITEIRRRILLPLGLRNTSFPLTSTRIPGPHAHGYIGTLDVTNLANPSVAWTSGAMISTVDDVARFYRALLTGRLLPEPEQRALLSTIPVRDTGELFPEHYGLGIYRVHLRCGTAWGHAGGYIGFKTFSYTSTNGRRQAVMAFNGFQMFDGKSSPAFRRDLEHATEIAFCGT